LQSRAKHLSVKLKYLYGVEKACTEWYFSQWCTNIYIYIHTYKYILRT
jgi:hypothetical protein